MSARRILLADTPGPAPLAAASWTPQRHQGAGQLLAAGCRSGRGLAAQDRAIKVLL
jgi:hypothetical protein